MADNASHTFFYSGLTPDYVRNAVDWARSNNLDPTRINTSLDGSLDVNTDVVVKNGTYTDQCLWPWWTPTSDGVVGAVECEYLLAGSGGKCDRFTMYLSRSWMNSSGVDTSQRRQLSCHESGHTVGLEHRSTGAASCMVQGYPKPSGFYDAHDDSHLNSTSNYP